jgi:alkylation response protein AidB-like acyl-CoA dehydrogenase
VAAETNRGGSHGDADEAFRRELREFLAAQSAKIGRAPRKRGERIAWQRRWCQTLAENGYAGPSWPREYGGMNLPFARQVIYAEELARAQVPGHPGTGVHIAAPTIIMYGTDEQRRRWLGPLLRAEVVWTQAWSEPNAGSDLPSLRTKAVRDGDHYVVTGQKIWSTGANHADCLYTLVRTGPPGSRERGISWLVVDAKSPGITIRPITDITGGSEFCEVFFEAVRVPIANRVGEENGGWRIARTSLGHERAALALNQSRFYRRIADEIHELARERGLDRDPIVRQKLAQLEIDVRLMYYCGARTIAEITRNDEPGPGSSVSRLMNSQIEQRIHEFALELNGAYAMLDGRDPHALQGGRWIWGYLRTRASTIGAGTAEIQRNTIAERVLGLPREPGAPEAPPKS